MRRRFSALLTTLVAAGLLCSCLDSATACSRDDLRALRDGESISRECDEYLPVPQDNLTAALIPLGSQIDEGSGARRVYLTASGHGDVPPTMRRDQLTVRVIAPSGDTTVLDTTRYSLRKLRDVAGARIAISSVIDYSGSMLDRDIVDANHLYRDLFTALDASGTRFESDIVLFSEHANRIVAHTSDSDTLRANLINHKNYRRGTTALHDAVAFGIRSSGERDAAIRLAIVTTDGRENDSRTHLSQESLYPLAADYGVRLVMLGSLFAEPAVLRDMARNTGGVFAYNRTLIGVREQFARFIAALTETESLEITGLPAGTLKLLIDYEGSRAAIDL